MLVSSQQAPADRLIIGNDGQAIKTTNYFDSTRAQRGLLYLSWNARAARLLVPDNQRAAVSEMQSAEYVIVSDGPSAMHHGRRCIEMLFEDHSDTPFALHISHEQCDRLLPASEHGVHFTFSVWTRDGMQLQLPARYRRVRSIPCLMQWGEG